MIDIVIPYIVGRWQNTELIYVLRSFEKHLIRTREIYVIGDDPDLAVNHVPCDNDSDQVYKERNIYRKIMMAVENPEISDPFLFANDDHFLLKDYDASEFPNYYGDWPSKSDMYMHTMASTRAIYPNAWFFDVHAPMLIDKERFIRQMAGVDWDKKGGYCLKTLYAYGLQGRYCRDMKIRYQNPVWMLKEMTRGREWFSICDNSRGPEMLALLDELYPEKSKYEL